MNVGAYEDAKKVIIIGNGIGGSMLAALLSPNPEVDVTVITPHQFIDISICMPKAFACGPEEYEKYSFPAAKEDNVKYIFDKVVALNDNSVTLSSGEICKFDICVVCTGIEYPLYQLDANVASQTARKQQVVELFNKMMAAKTIVIGGGGAVGVEQAADIKLRYPDKRVIVVHKSDRILKTMRPQFAILGEKFLRDSNIELLLNETVISHVDNIVTLKSGKTLDCDLYLACHGTKPYSSFIPAEMKDEKGFIKVDEYFLVQGMTNVFSFGDVCNRDHVKTFIRVEGQLPYIHKNILAKVRNLNLQKHVHGKSFREQIKGPLLVAFGHDLPNGYAIGPDFPGMLGFCNWLCCFCGPPCSTPAGKISLKMKNDFNKSVTPKKGRGIHA